MPLNDYVCVCGWSEEDVLRPLSAIELDCPECGERATRILYGARLIGPTPSRPMRFSGQSFDSTRGLETWRAKHAPGSITVATGSQEHKAQIDYARERAEAASRRLGHRDLDDRLQHVKRDKADKKRLAIGDVKTFSGPA